MRHGEPSSQSGLYSVLAGSMPVDELKLQASAKLLSHQCKSVVTAQILAAVTSLTMRLHSEKLLKTSDICGEMCHPIHVCNDKIQQEQFQKKTKVQN